MILSAFLINLKCRWLQSSLLPNTCIFAYGRFFHIFKITHFLKFWKDFLKIIRSTC